MAHLKLAQMEQMIAELAPKQYLYVETGMYKPWHENTVAAAHRRGYVVERRMPGVYYIYKKGYTP
jgi:hypothetical protein